MISKITTDMNSPIRNQFINPNPELGAGAAAGIGEGIVAGISGVATGTAGGAVVGSSIPLFLCYADKFTISSLCVNMQEGNIIYPKSSPPYVADYQNYVVSLFRKLAPSGYMVAINVAMPLLIQRLIRVGINYEHTLVRSGGRDSDGAVFGSIPVLDAESERYMIRLVNQLSLSRCNIIIDYSIPNILNVQSSKHYSVIASKHVYIAPALYPVVWNLQGRTIDILTTFLDLNVTRRKMFLGVCTNVSNCFTANEICSLYQRTKVLINVHQTDEHHTVEELRVLPAIQNGVIVVCEDSPLKYTIPYHSLIVWSKYENMLETARRVLESYEETWNGIFTESNKKLILSLHEANLNRLRDNLRANVE